MSFLNIFFIPPTTLLNIFKSFSTNVTRRSTVPKESKKSRESYPSMSRKLHQCHLSLLAGSAFATINGYLAALFFILILISLNLFFAFAFNAKSFAVTGVVVVFFLLLLVGVLVTNSQKFLLKAFLD